MDNLLSILLIVVFAIVIIVPVSISITKKKHGKNLNKGDNNNQVNGDNNTTNVNHIGVQNIFGSLGSNSSKSGKYELTSEEVKARIRILFVDDKSDFPIIKMLKDNGYQVEYLEDIINIDANKVKYADIIFLDINGVGVAMKFKNQGMGLCGALRDYYGTTKRLILYSGETEGSIFDKDAKKADATLPKDSDLYQFISYITQYGKELLEKVI